MQEAVNIRLLGEPELEARGRVLTLPPSKKTRALLGYLALSGRAHRREKLCSLLWDVADDPRAALRWSLSKLRELVDEPGKARLIADREQVALDRSDIRVDALEVRSLLGRGVEDASTATLESALSLFRGELLEGLELSDFHAYHAWCLAEREQLRRLHTEVLSTLLARVGARPERALPLARQLVDLDPLNAAARALFMELLHASGRAGEAEQQSRTNQRLLGARPSELGAREQRTREAQQEPARRTEQTPPLIGRERELARIEAALRADSAALCVLLVEAEAGVGKTRLLHAATARLAGKRLLESAVPEPSPGSPYAPWLHLLRSGLMRTADPALTGLLQERAGAEHEGLRERLFHEVVSALEHACAEHGSVVLVLDDCHWLDPGSAALFEHVVESCAALPICLLLAARPGALADNAELLRVLRALRRRGLLTELSLAPFTPEETAELLRSVTSPADPARVHGASGGNALFALELARVPTLQQADVPLSIARLVRDRISVLSAEVTDVLRWASVLGTSFDQRLLERIVALEPEAFVSGLEHLERHGYLRFDGGATGFAHDIVRAAIYDGLSSPRRQLMHKKVAQLLAELDDPSGAHAGELARHAALGGDASMATAACVAAGKRCLRLSAAGDAHALARRGLAYVDSLVEPERTTREIELLHLSVLARRPAPGDPLTQRLTELSRRALELAAIDHARVATFIRALLMWEDGHPSDAQRFTREAERICRLGGERERVLALGDAARCLGSLERDLVEAEAFLLEAEALAARYKVDVASTHLARSMLDAYRGEYESAERALLRAGELAREEGDRLCELYALIGVIELQLTRGDFARAAQASQELLVLGERSRPGSEVPFAHAAFALTQLAQGAKDAAATLDEALAALERADAKQRLGYLLCRAAELAFAHADLVRASEQATRALGLARLLERSSDVALALAVLLRVAAAQSQAQHVSELSAALKQALAHPLSAYARAAAVAALACAPQSPKSKERTHGARLRRTRIR